MFSFEEADSGVKINSHRSQEKVGPHSKLFSITLSVVFALSKSYVQMWLLAVLYVAIDNLVSISGS